MENLRDMNKNHAWRYIDMLDEQIYSFTNLSMAGNMSIVVIEI
jgi:hypothetical protein